MTLENPYSPPSNLSVLDASPPALPQAESDHYRDGEFLIVKDGAVLPHHCMVTNEVVAENGWRKRTQITWTPAWAFLAIFLGGLFVLIAILVFQKKGKITYSLSRQTWNKIVRRRGIGFGLLLAAVGLFFVGITARTGSDYTPTVIIGSILFLIASLVTLVVANPIKATKFKKGWFRIKGCSPAFLDTLPEISHSPFA